MSHRTKRKLHGFATTCMIVILLASSSSAFAAKKLPNYESSKTPEIQKKVKEKVTTPKKNKLASSTPIRITPLTPPTKTTSPTLSAPSLFSAQAVTSTTATTSSLGPNLITNNSVEASSSGKLPTGWNTDNYGKNVANFTYPASGYNSKSALKVSISSYSSGDAKWYFSDVPVTPGATYQYSDYYTSNVTSSIDIRYTKNDGSQTYSELASSIPASSAYKNTSVKFTIPQNVKSVTIYHLISRVGTLTTDEFSLNQISSSTTGTTTPPTTGTSTGTTTATTTPPTPPVAGNLVQNWDLEQAGTGGNPLAWNRGGYGTNSRTYTYPATGANGSKAAKVSISSYTSGDAKWYFNPIQVQPGTYTYSDDFTANIPSTLTVQYQAPDGTYSYLDIGKAPASSASFSHLTFDFTVPAGVSNITVFHLIEGVGTLNIDNVSVVQKSVITPQIGGIFSTGAVTLRFDDGWASNYDTVLPKLKSDGLKGTFFIVSQQLGDNGFSGFLTKPQIQALYSAGNEIGAHTRTHPDLTLLSTTSAQNEILGSRNDLLAMNVGPITSFSYPYGNYNSDIMSLVEQDGFSDAAATIDGEVTPLSDRYQLERLSVESNVTFAQAKQWIDNALAKKEWLILTFHQVDTSGEQYSTTPAIFGQIADYLKQVNAPIVTIAEGAKALP